MAGYLREAGWKALTLTQMPPESSPIGAKFGCTRPYWSHDHCGIPQYLLMNCVIFLSVDRLSNRQTDEQESS